MKIVFICSSLELGKDGVGDYTRRLAGELIRKGYTVCIIAFHDKYIDKIQQEVQITQDYEVPTLRLPSGISWNKRIKMAKEYVDEFNPDWLSLQYVPYGFQEKGLPFGLVNSLIQISAGRKWNIMFHELWIGRGKAQPLRRKVVSYFQEFLITRLIKTLHPECIHTHLPIYKEKLQKISSKVYNLPLFATISIYPFKKDSKTLKNNFRMAFFSQVILSFSVIQFLKDFTSLLLKKGYHPEVIFIGGNKQKMDELKAVLEKELKKTTITTTGFLPEQEVSEYIYQCQLGVTSVPRHALGKSASVAAFLSHGVPVAAPYVHEEMRGHGQIGFYSDNLKKTIQLHPSWEEYVTAKEAVQLYKEEIMLPLITANFVVDLQVSEKV
ncbi:glycosyltransferase [Runella sp. MFBS21]|uniref:glycosyltransferase n=1 Tax=Runella sp. MFBS21 TaxID=3034018 RepID=UPI0023F90AED|nr:glycosyltransferase [Runella sp. MFBS21]MDF7820397.1 glycosyltransferase [Runella sp. MFBS21]